MLFHKLYEYLYISINNDYIQKLQSDVINHADEILFCCFLHPTFCYLQTNYETVFQILHSDTKIKTFNLSILRITLILIVCIYFLPHRKHSVLPYIKTNALS